MAKTIYAENAPKAIGPYSHGYRFGNLIVTSGQIPVDPKTNEVVAGGVVEQTTQVMENIKAVLQAAGASLTNVVKTTVFIKDMNQFAAINEVYGKYFTINPPARSCVEVARLPKDILVEIEALAYVE